MQYKGQQIEGDFAYIANQQCEHADVLDVFANVIERSENAVTIERFNNFGRHQLPTVVKPLWEFEKDYREITEEEKTLVSAKAATAEQIVR